MCLGQCNNTERKDMVHINKIPTQITTMDLIISHLPTLRGAMIKYDEVETVYRLRIASCSLEFLDNYNIATANLTTLHRILKMQK